jgi:hypothetical protein
MPGSGGRVIRCGGACAFPCGNAKWSLRPCHAFWILGLLADNPTGLLSKDLGLHLHRLFPVGISTGSVLISGNPWWMPATRYKS